MSVADSAVGAILEIPPQALADIQKAQRYIDNLQITSKRAAEAVKTHWGTIAVSGLDTFIQRLADAHNAMKGLDTINVTLNTQAAVQSTEQLSTATQRTSADVSKAVQDMAQSWNDLAKVSLKGFDLSVYGKNLTEVQDRLATMKKDLQNGLFTEGKGQSMTDEIRRIEEAIRLYKQAADEKNKALSNIQQKQQAQTDKEYLTEQKRLLDRILQLRKDIANISISVQRGTITGKEDMSKDLAQLEQLRKELRETGNEYRKLQILGQPKISDEALLQSQIQSQNAKNAGLRQEFDERNKLNQAITRANELTAQGQQGKTRLGSGEEAAIQRQLNSDYKAMIGIIREKGQIQANAAEQGRSLTQKELDLIAALDARYKIYESDIQRVSSAYSKMAEAAARNFQADKSEQLARNAIALADAQNKAAEAAQKVADAQAKAAQQQSDKDRSQAESELNRLYTERLRLLKEKEQLENKALVNTAQGLPDLTAKENQLLSELTAKLQSVDSQIKTIGNSYAGLAAKAKHAYELPELRQAVRLQNQFNEALKSVDTANAKKLTAEYKRLTAEAQKLAQSMREYTAAGGDRTSTAYTQLEAQFRNIMMQRRIIEMENIDEVNNYRQQRQTAAYQADLSAFVQAEAQKTAEAKKQAEERAKQQAEAQQKYLNTYAGAIQEFYRLGRRGGNYADTYENRERVIKNLEAAIKSLNRADSDYEKKLKDLTDALNILKNAQKEVTDAMKPTKPMVSPQDAINAAKNATSLKQLQDAYTQLLEVMKNMNPNDPQWKALQKQLGLTKKEIEEIKKKMGEFQSQASKTSGLMGQLQGRIAAAFSIGAIAGFIKKMVEVRAQFELQRVALGAIIQDKDEANKIFLQVQQMALQSPFSIMQLERATKQIAAFGFETKKLVPTMKMFADISAGLGVEIDRLVLVMGHLKARNFLEGCLGLGTPVKMADGSVKCVENILQGESIMGDDDTPRIVKQIIRGNEQMYKVCYADGSFRCNENHILTLFNTEKNVIEDVYVLDYLKTPDTYKGVRRTNGRFEYFDITVEKDMVDDYYGFVIDGNRRFQLGDGTVTHNTMVRQFTNMGFNVLGELSKYYSELEDRMVSVGEVQDRVKKKMISFEDVEEVLKRVTSAGGMFYDMQKKQSDSLWGQMQRIKDAYDLMLNEIGQSNEGFLKSALTVIRGLIQSWRTLRPYIVAAVTAMGSYMVVAMGYKVITLTLNGLRFSYLLLTKGIQAAKAAQQALNITMMSNPWAAAAAALTALVVYIWQATTATSKLNEELNRIGSDVTDSLNESIVTFKQLADTISDTNSTYTERTEAMTEMRRIYADILPKEKLEIAYIQSLRGNYGELTKAIQDYYQQKEYNQKVEAIQGSDEAKKVQEELERALNRMNEDGAFGIKYSKSMIKSWSDTIAKEINTGKIPATLDSLESRIKEVFNAKDLSMFRNETYGVSDMYDVMQKVEEVQEAYGNITLETANAENALTSYQNSLKKFDFSQLDEAKKSLQEQKDSLQQAISSGKKGFSGTAGGRPIYGTMQMDPSEIEELKERLKGVESQIKAVDEAQSQWLSNQFKEKVEGLNNVLFKDVEAYKAAQNEMRKLEMQGKKNTEEWKKQESAMNAARESADKTADTYDTKVNWSLINSAQTSFELRGELDKLATKAFPKVAELAMKSLSKLQEYLLKSKNTVYEWVKGLLEWVPENARDALGLNSILTNVNENLALTQTQLDELANVAAGVEDKGKAAGKSFEELISDKAKTRVEEFGGNITDIDRIISDTSKGADEMAKELRSQAKSWEETAQSYRTSTDKALWLDSRTMTEESIELMEKNAKAAKALATDIAGEDNKSKKGGKDEISELWKNRLKAIQDFYKRYEELRKHFNEEESLTRAKDAFTPLFKTLEMNINDVIAKGMSKQGLVLNLEEMTKEVAKVRENLVDEFQKATADTQIQVDFKIKEDAENELKKQLDEMFDNYELTNELKKMGVSVDLTYMVGGKPTTLADIRKAIARLRAEGGGSADAENRIKTLEDAEKKMTQIELKEHKERLKNYEKYLKQMYSDRAKKMIEAYTDMKNMEQDFNSFIAKLQEEASKDDTTDERKQQIAEQIKSLKFQKAEAIKAVNEALNQNLAKLDWEQFKGSDVFTQLYQDTENLSKKGIDLLIKKLEDARTALQSMEKVDYRAVREITNHIEKLQNVKLDTSSWGELTAIIKKAKETIGDVSLEDAQQNMIDAQSKIDAANNQIAQIQAIIDLKEQEGNEDDKIKNLSEEQRDLYNEDIDALRDKLATQQDIVKEQQAEADKNEKIVDSYDTQRNAIKKKIAIVDQLKQEFDKVYQSVVDVADALGNDTDIWAEFGQAIADSVFSCITLTLQMQLLGIAANSALGIIGWIATALQVVANLLVAIFKQHDKRLQKQIEGLEDRVDRLSKAFEKLQKSIERAFSIGKENQLTDQALANIESQKKAYQEMIRLEEAKKKTDDDKIKDYKDKLEELAEAEEELYEKRHEKWGSTNDVWDEANNWVDAWLDAYKETGDGLDALNDSWDEFYENLVKKQAASKVLGARMDSWITEINEAIDKNMGSEYDYIDLFKSIGEKMKAEFDATNADLKKIFEYAGIGGGAGNLILSDLQKGIQNITEPQAAAIEAYLNSMRFAVFRHTEQLDTLIATIQMQYGSGAENPVVTELKGIRSILDSINTKFDSVIGRNGSQKGIRIAT